MVAWNTLQLLLLTNNLAATKPLLFMKLGTIGFMECLLVMSATTMDPSKRTLLRVTWDAAGEADQLFSILMGENVEQRRAYIEKHALEVKNLDV